MYTSPRWYSNTTRTPTDASNDGETPCDTQQHTATHSNVTLTGNDSRKNRLAEAKVTKKQLFPHYHIYVDMVVLTMGFFFFFEKVSSGQCPSANGLQCIAVCCSVLQRFAVCCTMSVREWIVNDI